MRITPATSTTHTADITNTDAADTPTLTPEAIAAFWRDFAAREAELAALADSDPRELVESGTALLQQHASGLALEIQPRHDGQPQHLLVITAHGDIGWFEPLMQLAQAAPALTHFTVTAFRARTPGADRFVMGMQDFELAATDVLAQPAVEQGSVTLTLGFNKPIGAAFLEHAKHMTFIMLDHILGEYDFAVRVSTVNWSDTLSAQSPNTVALPELPAVFDALRSNGLGYTGQIVSVEDSHITLLEGRSAQGKILIRLNTSARSTATRADMGIALTLELAFADSKGLERANAAEDQITAQIAHAHAGLFALARTEIATSQRQLVYYVSDEAATRRIMEQSARDHDLPCSITREYDPAWERWRQYLLS